MPSKLSQRSSHSPPYSPGKSSRVALRGRWQPLLPLVLLSMTTMTSMTRILPLPPHPMKRQRCRVIIASSPSLWHWQCNHPCCLTITPPLLTAPATHELLRHRRVTSTGAVSLYRYAMQYRMGYSIVTCIPCKIAFAASITYNIAFVATNATRIW
jgi:hypothetical protein